MPLNIVIIGSTGELGSKLLNYTNKHHIKIYAATCYKNIKKLNLQKSRYRINKIYALSSNIDKKNFLNLLKKRIDLIYFLDFGSSSLIFLNTFLNNNSNSTVAIANKEMIIAGGKYLFDKFKKTKNTFISLDSEHFSLRNNLLYPETINKIYITASGGPFFFNKSKSINKANLSDVLNHPKWKMGINNLIDSSNFINKILEIYELSYIYKIPLEKIDFLISKEAFIHSIVKYNDGIISFNTFKNDMLITLIYPLKKYFEINHYMDSENFIFNKSNFEITKKLDKRFIFFKYFKKMKKFNHCDQIKLMLINNHAQSLYLDKKIRYIEIIPYTIKKMKKFNNNPIFKNFQDIVSYIDNLKLQILKND